MTQLLIFTLSVLVGKLQTLDHVLDLARTLNLLLLQDPVFGFHLCGNFQLRRSLLRVNISPCGRVFPHGKPGNQSPDLVLKGLLFNSFIVVLAPYTAWHLLILLITIIILLRLKLY